MVVEPLAKMIGCWAVSLLLTSVIFSGPVSGTKFLHEETDFHDEVCFWKTLTAHPIFNAIKEKSRLSGLERQMKNEEIKQMIAKFGPDINRIPRVKPNEDTLQTQNNELDGWCWIEGFTPLHYCALLDDVETARLLVENGSDIYQTGGPDQGNCLHATVYTPSLKVAKFLIKEVKMDKERQTDDGLTALDLAQPMAEYFNDPQSIELVQLLTDRK